MTTRSPKSHPQSGPPLAAPAAVVLGLTIVSVVTFGSGPRPDTSASETLDYLRDHQGLVSVTAFLVFAASLPLAVFAGTAYRRLRRLGVTAPGSAIAFAGGLLAAASLAVSGLTLGVAGRAAPDATAGVERVLIDLSFAAGGVGFAAPLALLLAGLAVPGVILRLLPRWFAALGFVPAVAGAVSTFGLIGEALYPLLPVARFGGLLWLVLAGALLPTSIRHAATAASR